MIYNPAENHWDTFADWPKVDEKHLTPDVSAGEVWPGLGEAGARRG